MPTHLLSQSLGWLCPIAHGASAPQGEWSLLLEQLASDFMTFSSSFLLALFLPPLLDLTRYGVEPNPGPPKKATMKSAVAPVVVIQQAKKPKKKKSGGGGGKGSGGSGGSVGSKIGSSIGGWIGNAAQSIIQKITGLGDYQVTRNSIVSAGSGPPAFMNGGGCTKIAHREFLGLVSSPGANFSIFSYALNPFSSSTFPWLSEIAGSFETFQFKGIVFEFKSTSGDAVSSTNASLGSVILATQYNAAAPPFANQVTMENYEYATSTKPSVSMIHPVECDPSQLPMEHLYVFNNDISTSTDPRWANLGVTYIATVGQQAAAVLGELWVSYDIEFYQPRLTAVVPNSGLGVHYLSIVPAATFSGTTVFSNMAASAPSGDLYLAFTGGRFTFPPGLGGTYQVTLQMCIETTSGNGQTGFGALTSLGIGSGSLLNMTYLANSLPVPLARGALGIFPPIFYSAGSGNAMYIVLVVWVTFNPSASSAAYLDFTNVVGTITSPVAGSNVGVDLFVSGVPFAS